MSRSVQRAFLKSILVAADHRLKSVDSWVKDVAIQGKAVCSSLVIGRNRTTETIQSNLLVGVVVLKNLAYVSYGLKILIPVRIKVVQ